ncbi:hypothetical protein LPYR103PRE_07810 [Segatella asaccharophila]|jgi:hypothetical protein|nr:MULTISPECIES: hypothetical protein [unclassified Prevotella]
MKSKKSEMIEQIFVDYTRTDIDRDGSENGEREEHKISADIWYG